MQLSLADLWRPRLRLRWAQLKAEPSSSNGERECAQEMEEMLTEGEGTAT